MKNILYKLWFIVNMVLILGCAISFIYLHYVPSQYVLYLQPIWFSAMISLIAWLIVGLTYEFSEVK